MSSSAARTKASRRGLLFALLGVFPSLVAAACGGEVPAPSAAGRAKGKKGRVDPIELFPADLDLVVRVDLGRMRAQLGPLSEALSQRVEEEGEKAEVLAALALKRAKIAWIGVRLADLEAGDRLLVVQGDVEDLHPDPAIYRLIDPPLREDIKTFEREGDLPRGATARIHQLGAQTIAFVTPVEVDSVARVLREGPDPGRRDPSAEGLVSADLRARRLPASLEKRFPSIASIVRGLDRARAVVAMAEEALRLDLQISATTDAAAQKTEKLVSVLVEGGRGSRYAPLFEDVRIERLERSVSVRWSLSPSVLRSLLDGTIKAAEPVEPSR